MTGPAAPREPVPARDGVFGLLFIVMLTIAAGNTALQSVLPALGRSLRVPDNAVAAAYSVSALVWVVAAPRWARRSDAHGRRAMILLGLTGFSVSLALCGAFLAAGINGVIGGTAAFIAFIGGRLVYGLFGSAAPPAVQALVAGNTTAIERTRALTLIASAFGLGTVLGPAIAPYFVIGRPFSPPLLRSFQLGLAGPAFAFSIFGLVVLVVARIVLPNDRIIGPGHGAAVAYPSIGGQSSGASVTAATAPRAAHVGWRDPRIRGWMMAGLVTGNAQTIAGQTIGFLVIDRLMLAPVAAIEPTKIVLMMGAGAALLVQWGLIPMLGLDPRRLVLWGLILAAIGTALTGLATSLSSLATAYALASAGYGFTRPGFTAGSSLAVDADEQGSVAGKVTSVNGAAFVLGPSIGIGLYQINHALPYLLAAATLLVCLVYAIAALRQQAGVE